MFYRIKIESEAKKSAVTMRSAYTEKEKAFAVAFNAAMVMARVYALEHDCHTYVDVCYSDKSTYYMIMTDKGLSTTPYHFWVIDEYGNEQVND